MSTAASGIALPEGLTGSSFLHTVLHDAVERFPSALSEAGLPDTPRAFKKDFGGHLVRFEVARVASPERAAIGRFLADRTHELLSFVREGERSPLGDFLAQSRDSADPGPLQERRFSGQTGWVPEIPFRGEVYRGRAVGDLVDLLHAEHQVTDAAAEGLRWMVDRLGGNGGSLDLTGERFVLLGAGAELSPCEGLLRAGATVLYVDLGDPLERLSTRHDLDRLSGQLVYAEGARDLLEQTAGIVSAIRRFAEKGPVHLGLFAYAGGKGREVRLTAGMDAVVRALPHEAIRSVGLYISPTTPACVQPEDRRAAEARLQASTWRTALGRLGVLRTPGQLPADPHTVARAVVPLQGAGYLAAQYLSKMALAERWATGDAPVTVSANVAPITNTSSLEHPLFQAAFLAARSVEVEIFEPATTRNLSALLWLRDVLDPGAPGAVGRRFDSDNEKAAAVLSQQIHGGVYTQPWLFESTIQLATLMGLARQPSRILQTVRAMR